MLRPPGDRRPAPGAFLRGDVDEVDQRGAGAQLEHAILGQRILDGAADHVAVEGSRRGHVVDQQDDMVDAFEREGGAIMAPGRQRKREAEASLSRSPAVQRVVDARDMRREVVDLGLVHLDEAAAEMARPAGIAEVDEEAEHAPRSAAPGSPRVGSRR